MKKTISYLMLSASICISVQAQNYQIVGTGQTNSYNNTTVISIPGDDDDYYGQNSNYPGNSPSYTDNGDGTISDNVTGLMWEQTSDQSGNGRINYYDKMTYEEALEAASSCNTGGYTDWRLPSVKELYSLIMYYGAEPSPTATSVGSAVPFIDTDYFDFDYGDLNASKRGADDDERLIDAQYATTSIYVSTTMNNSSTMFGVNFADGRIKGYPSNDNKSYYVMYVRDNIEYGTNDFEQNGDGTITDNATGLMWMKNDTKSEIDWESALSYAEDFKFLGYTDWRLPDIKELQSIIDYTKSPETTNSAAIDAIFNCTSITNEAGESDYPYYMSSTTFSSQNTSNGTDACYVSFGRAMGYIESLGGWIDVHGAGSQRSDPKTGDASDYPTGFGPQGDAIRINNYARLVRNVSLKSSENTSSISPSVENNIRTIYPNPVTDYCTINLNKQCDELVIEILSMDGKLISKQVDSMTDQVILDTSELQDGIYIARIYFDGTSITKKIIKD